MARPLDQRLAGALSNGRVARDSDLADLQSEARDARQRALAAAEQADRDAVDIALAETDREAAAAKAEKSRRDAQAYGGAIEQLEAKLAERNASAKRQAAEAERVAALAERDALAERFGAVVPGIVETLTGLFGDVLANETRLQAAGLAKKPNAEAAARGVPHSWTDSLYAEIQQFTRMQIPNWSASGRVWPRRTDRLLEPLADWDKQQRRIERDVKARAAEREAATWGWYRLARGKARTGGAVFFEARQILPNRGPTDSTKRRVLWKGQWSGGLRRTEAERLRELGVTVEEIDQRTAEREQLEREAAE
jgi:hypothetical protein